MPSIDIRWNFKTKHKIESGQFFDLSTSGLGQNGSFLESFLSPINILTKKKKF